MKCKEVLAQLNISRPTLSKYVKTGLIKIDKEINGHYVYNDKSVKRLLGNTEYDDHPLIKTDDDKTEEEKVEQEMENTKTIEIKEVDAKILTIDQVNIERLSDCVNGILDLFNQLSQMRLLTPASINKVKQLKKEVEEIKESNWKGMM